MDRLKVTLIAYPAAELSVYSKAKRRLQKLFQQDRVEFVDKNPEILVFITGGSERVALELVQEHGFYLLLASSEENSWAAATEVKSWMNQNNIESILVDQSSDMAQDLLESLFLVKNGIHRLRGQKFGMVGSPSSWLVNSVINPFIIKTKLGVEQVDIPWNEVNISEQKKVEPDFSSFFKHNDRLSIDKAGKVYEALSEQVRKHSLQALTVECFSLIHKECTTACLGVAKLSMDGIPTGCEGDICCILGMMITKELFGIVPWQANVSAVKGNKITFAHCTAPPNLLKDFEIDTHYETGEGLAIKGELKAEEVTIFRLDNTLSRIFVGSGEVDKAPYKKTMCRTQLTVKVSKEISDYFINNPLGNHHLILPGDYSLGLEMLTRMLNLKQVQ